MACAAAVEEARCFAAAACDERSRLWVVVCGDSLYRGASCLDSVDMLDVAKGTWAHAGSLLACCTRVAG